MWKQIPEKQRKKTILEHKKKQQHYVAEFENFVRVWFSAFCPEVMFVIIFLFSQILQNLPTDKLKDFRAFMKNRENENRENEKKASADEVDDEDDDDEEDEEEQASSVEDAHSSEEENNSFSSNDEEQALSSSDED